MLRQVATALAIDARGRGLHEITEEVCACVAQTRLSDGFLTLFVGHTSASLPIQENTDPDVRGDLDRFFARLVRDGDALFRHRDEEPDDIPAHVRVAWRAVPSSVSLSGAGAGGLAGHLPLGASGAALSAGRFLASVWERTSRASAASSAAMQRLRSVGATPRTHGRGHLTVVRARAGWRVFRPLSGLLLTLLATR